MRDFLQPKVSAVGLLHAIGVLAALGTITAFLARWGWWFELTCHFRLQYALGLAAVAVLTAVIRPRTAVARRTGPRARWPSLVCALLALVNFAVLSPYLIPKPDPAAAGMKRLRVLTLNVHTANPRHDLVEAFLRRENPDVIVLTEVDARWLTQLVSLTNTWPHSVQAPRNDNFGIALFSRCPLERARVAYLGEAGAPSIEAQTRIEGPLVSFLGTHPLPPGSAENSRLRDEQLDRVAQHLAAQPGPRVLLGDLNATPWSPVFRRLLARSGLVDSLRGRGYQPTWPGSFFPFWIPLDHCLVSRELTVMDRRIGPRLGSDHLPVIVDLALPATP